MSIATIYSAHIVGLDAEKVAVEVDVSHGLYSFTIVGLPDRAVDESKDRIIAALKNTHLKNPKTENHKVTVSLSPAHIKKEGTHFDVPIALSYLVASKQITIPTSSGWFIGELSLSGAIVGVHGVLAIVEKAKSLGVTSIYVPEENKEEASLIEGIAVYPCAHLLDILSHFGCTDTKEVKEIPPYVREKNITKNETNVVDFSAIKGQTLAKRALLIAATGGHNITLYGPPGTGKSMLAKAFVGILPPLEERKALEVTKIHSITKRRTTLITTPPLRSPHHTSSYVAIVGGGANPRPGEITLAHNGVLFLDEFPEFDKKVLEALREPLEEGSVSVSRAKGTYTFPASITLIAAMNPCPCGYYGSSSKRCSCSLGDIDRYARKLSGPIMDRIDMWVKVSNVDYETLSKKEGGESTELYSKKVIDGRTFAQRRQERNGKLFTRLNKELTGTEIEEEGNITEEGRTILDLMAKEHSLSPRAYHRVLRLARTIADLRASNYIEKEDILEAFQYRPKIYGDRV